MIGVQLTIPELKAHLSYSANAVGALGEVLIARALEKQGYQVDISHVRGDLTVILPDGQTIGIEVKTARRNKDKKWHFTLYKYWQGSVRTDHRNADLVVLVCVMKAGDVVPYVVPVSAFGTRKAVAISSLDYRGWLSPFRQNIRNLRIQQ